MSMPAAISKLRADDLAASRSRVGDQGPGGGHGIVAARADAQHAVGRLDHVAVAGHQQRVPGVDHGQQRLQPPQGAIGAPILGQLRGGAGHVRRESRCSLASNRSSRAKASALLPAKPVMTLPSIRRRILSASAFITVLPSVTWPSPPMATMPLWRTLRIVVERVFIGTLCGFRMGRYAANRSMLSARGARRLVGFSNAVAGSFEMTPLPSSEHGQFLCVRRAAPAAAER